MKGRSDCDDWRVPGQKWYQSLLKKRKTTANGRDQSQSRDALNQGRNYVYGRSQEGIGDQGRRFTLEREKSGITRGLANLRLDRGVKPVRMKTVGSAMVRGRLPVGRSMIRKEKNLKENSRRISLAKRMKRARDLCYIIGMFDGSENGEQFDHLDESDLEIKRQSEESYLKDYFEHLDEGLEKENNPSTHDKRGQESTSKMKDKEINDQVKSIKDMVEFLDLLIHEKLIIENKEDFEKGFVKMVKWFYGDYLESGVEKDVPPVIEGQEINMLDLYMVVNRMGGSNKVSRKNKWVEVASKLGFPGFFDVKLRVCYMKYFDLIDCYYSTVIGNKIFFGDQDQVDEALVQKKVKDDQDEDKWEGWKWKQRAVNAKRDYPLMCGQVLILQYYEVDHDAAMLGSEESKTQIGYEGDNDDSSDDDLVIILN
ncbi:hypothetical protein L1987_23468 [Smallanthus sonchifolius]|uniref:Uncharacterized protein n=1 Tax=Smallanthus sonchifolius TaxID=185202 RepID=A0ACB9IIM0_9ASTR|nr:hypothetical protein L1987_23468 [Smallanthus sonchifolius]